MKHVCDKHGEDVALVVCESCNEELVAENRRLKRQLQIVREQELFNKKPISNNDYEYMVYNILDHFYKPVCKSEFIKYVTAKLSYGKPLVVVIHEGKEVNRAFQRLVKKGKIKYKPRQPLVAK